MELEKFPFSGIPPLRKYTTFSFHRMRGGLAEPASQGYSRVADTANDNVICIVLTLFSYLKASRVEDTKQNPEATWHCSSPSQKNLDTDLTT